MDNIYTSYIYLHESIFRKIVKNKKKLNWDYEQLLYLKCSYFIEESMHSSYGVGE